MGNRLVIGVDPDSAKLAIAIFCDGKLSALREMTLPFLIENIKCCKDSGDDILFSIEDACANNFVYSRNQKATRGAMAAVGLSIGRCQQSQVELMRWLDYLKIPYQLHKPTKSNWHDNRALFEKITEWTKQSNDDTRSAAYFGWLGTSKCQP